MQVVHINESFFFFFAVFDCFLCVHFWLALAVSIIWFIKIRKCTRCILLLYTRVCMTNFQLKYNLSLILKHYFYIEYYAHFYTQNHSFIKLFTLHTILNKVKQLAGAPPNQSKQWKCLCIYCERNWKEIYLIASFQIGFSGRYQRIVQIEKNCRKSFITLIK